MRINMHCYIFVLKYYIMEYIRRSPGLPLAQKPEQAQTSRLDFAEVQRCTQEMYGLLCGGQYISHLLKQIAFTYYQTKEPISSKTNITDFLPVY